MSTTWIVATVARRRRSTRPTVVREPLSRLKRSRQEALSAGSRPAATPAARAASAPKSRTGQPTRDRVGPGDRASADGLQPRDDRVGEAGAEKGRRHRHGHRLDQHEPEDPGAARADRRARRVLLLPLEAAREEEPADVGARDQEQQADRAEERDEQALTLPIEDRSHRRRGRGEAGEPGIGRGDAARHRGELALGLRRRHPGLQAGDGVAGAALRAGFVRRHGEPEVDLGVQVVVGLGRGAGIGQEAQAGRHHADDRQGRRHPAERDRTAQDVLVARRTRAARGRSRAGCPSAARRGGCRPPAGSPPPR